jgi:aminocarboxymuconate-semialdehyde decarboxylase
MKIDIFNHIAPQRFLDALLKKTKVVETPPPTLSNIELRTKFMDKFEDLVQVLSLPPFDFASLDNKVSTEDNIELCKIANDEMAELLVKYPDRFVGACASLPMTDMDAALKELDRAIIDLGFCGIHIFTDVKGKPLDSPEFGPLFEKMNHYNLPILLHPTWSRTNPEYPGEKAARYLSVVTITFPYQTMLALNRLVFSGVMEDNPDLKIITHHCGGMLPFVSSRIAFTYASSQVLNKGAISNQRYLSRHPMEYFHRFFGDTVTAGSIAALKCGYQFFGADRLLFGTDAPMDSQAGIRQTEVSIRAIEQLDIGEEEKRKIFELNAIELFRLPLSPVE